MDRGPIAILAFLPQLYLHHFGLLIIKSHCSSLLESIAVSAPVIFVDDIVEDVILWRGTESEEGEDEEDFHTLSFVLKLLATHSFKHLKPQKYESFICGSIYIAVTQPIPGLIGIRSFNKDIRNPISLHV